MAGIKALAKDTAIYGISSIVGRFLNWCLVPLYVYLFPTEEYGIVSYLYSFTAVALVILNYGMETGFFRFASRHEKPDTVYTTSLLSVGSTSLLFIILLSIFINPIATGMRLEGKQLYILLLGIIVAIDAFSNIPFAYLRYKHKAVRFATIKFANIGINIALNLFFLLLCPKLQHSCPQLIGWFYTPLGGASFGIGWIFVANMISTLCVLAMLLPQLVGPRYRFDGALLRKMLRYSWPLLILGVAGIMSQNMGQMVIPYLFTDQTAARSMVGIYGANIKIAIVMVMFTQAFRYAYEPFIFAQDKGKGTSGGGKSPGTKAYCDAMKFFVILGLLIFLAVMFYLPLIKHFVSRAYWGGLDVVPIMMAAELCCGVAFNLSLWYKLTDRTQWGMYLSVGTFIIMLALNIVFVPLIGIPDGYMGSAWAALISYFIMMAASYFIGRRYYPLPYELRTMALYLLLAAVLWGVGTWLCAFPGHPWLMYLTRTLLLLFYLFMIARFEHLPIPGLHKRRFCDSC